MAENGGASTQLKGIKKGDNNNNINNNNNNNKNNGNDNQKVPFYKLFAFADKQDAVLMIVGTISAIGSGLAHPFMTLIFGHLINSFGSSDRSHVVHEVSKVAVKFLYLAAGTGIAAFLQVSCWMVTGERQATRIRGLYLKTILRQDIGFFDTETTTGEVIGRMSGDTILIQEAMGEKVGKFIQLMSTFFGGFVVALARGWFLALVLLACLPAIVIAGGSMALIMSKMSSRGQIAYSEAGTVVEQTVSGIRTVSSFTGEKQAIEKYNNKLQVAYRAAVQQGMVSGIGLGVLMLTVIGTYGLAVWYGSKLIIEKGYNGGTVINVIMAIMTGGMSLGQTSPCLNAFAGGQAAAYKMFETIKRKPKIDPYDTSGITLEKIEGEIELRDVYFRYPARPEVQIFAGFSLHVPSGTTAALVGQSGSGKSTVISLVERFYDPDAGEVLIDGIDIKKLQLKWIREKIGLVSQEPILFATSLRENIAYGKENATDQEIRTAIELANAAKFIDKLPKGLDTMAGEHGTQLSGGQKQRIAIARAILKNPKILLLDEATSALDAESERIVQDALVKIMTSRTTVVVAHRLTTIRNADLIAVVHQGKIVEKGTHDELIKDPEGPYTQLVRLQEGSKEAEDALATDADKLDSSFDILDKAMTRSGSRGESMRRSISRHSSGSRHSFGFTYGVPGPINVFETEEGGQGGAERTPLMIEKRQKLSMRRLAYLNKPEFPVLLIGSIAAGIHGVIFPIFGLLLSSSIRMFFEPEDKLRKDSRFWALIYLVLGIINLIAVPFQNYFFGVAGGKLIRRIRSLTFEKVVHQEISWFDDPANSSGSVGARLSTDASTIRSLVGDSLALVVQNIATIAAGLIIAFTANWILAFVILAVSPLMLVQGYTQTKFMKGFSADAKLMYEEASQVANDAVGSIRTVASFCSEEKVMDLYEKKCEGPLKNGVRRGILSGAGFGFSFLVLYCTNAFCFYIGSVLVEHGKATFGQVFKVFFALTISALGVSQTSAMAPDTTKAKDSAASIFEILDSKPKIDSSKDEGMTLSSVGGAIELRCVSFKYPTRPDVQIFRNLCLSIPSGKTVALVGESGSGKSTVIALIERFYDPDSGHVLLDNIELPKFKLSWLRQQMGLVSQEPVLFNETIRTNIAYGKQGGATEEEIIAATEASNAHNFISALPHGYETNVGERGVQLSGGQKQRIAIARAVLKNPKILLLDEATSALDAESERVVQDALERVMVNRTTVVVAHRLTTIKNADIIAVVKNGVIAEQGSHDALMKITDGAYASLVALHTMAACLPAIVIAGGITATVVAKLSCRGQIAYAEAEMLLSTQLEPLEDYDWWNMSSYDQSAIPRYILLKQALKFAVHVPSGTTVALVGQSGSGKSTVINLVESFRFYAPEAEQVKAETCNCKGHLKEPKNSSSDEATNAVDAQSERIVQAAMVKLVTNRTVVIVANCLITIRNADCIMVVSKGKIVEKGCNARPAVLVLPLSRTTFEAVILKRSPSVKVKHILRGFPGPMGVYETAERSEGRIEKDPTEIEKRNKVSVTRLAYVNRSEQKSWRMIPSFGQFCIGAVGARLSTDASAVRSVVALMHSASSLGQNLWNMEMQHSGKYSSFWCLESTAVAPNADKAKGSAASIFEILESKPKIDWSSKDGMTPSTVRGDIVFEHTVALVGENGNGKSTVISLAERFHNPEQNYCGCGSPPYHYKNADITSVVKNGVIAEKGRHDALMKITDGTYASLTALHMSS
ncbi:ABC transporter B family member 9 [Citrus sinensis]|uniref:ABC transporter B family member 9 n=1 Tax=Citrus sinensis TaxID=2711 RepID=A0ACB8NJ20_CITSI|nr:ABC transporter B family member 9 [Citrus sinensis]